MAVTARVCVFCRRHPVHPDWPPFCSERCKLQDLAKWVDGEYRISAEPVSSLAEDDAESGDDTGNHS